MSVFQSSEGKKTLALLSEFMSSPRKVVIVTHFNPDGDAMGSTLGLAHFLKKKKHKVQIITPNPWPGFIDWMPGLGMAVDFEHHEKKSRKNMSDAEIVFCLDFNHPARVGPLMEGALRGIKAPMVVIDHHQQPDTFARYLFSDTTASSTCEMVFQYISAMGEEALVDEAISSCLYTGMMTDTGSFRFASTTPATHLIAAELLQRGCKHDEIHSHIFDNNSVGRMQLLGFCLSEKMMVLPELHAAFISLRKDELERFHYRKGDTEGVVNYPLSIEGIRLSALFIEREEEIKISFRSRGDIDVNKLARALFKGGGHINAAGANTDLSMDEAISAFVQALHQNRESFSA
jgi:phosphoesterase RecJ-like protein